MNNKKAIFATNQKPKKMKEEKPKPTPKHYGKALSKAIEKKGIKKKYIFFLLGISKPTLNKRLIDGAFTSHQKFIVDANFL